MTSIFKEHTDEVPWTPFVRTYSQINLADPNTQRDIEAAMKAFTLSREQVEQAFLEKANDEIYRNSRYQVNIVRTPAQDERFGMIHLSLKRLDKGTFISWRDKQRIKNELVGEEFEAVELFPAESRLIDAANQFHLWVVDDPTFRWPLGFNSGRHVHTEAHLGNARQDDYEK